MISRNGNGNVDQLSRRGRRLLEQRADATTNLFPGHYFRDQNHEDGYPDKQERAPECRHAHRGERSINQKTVGEAHGNCSEVPSDPHHQRDASWVPVSPPFFPTAGSVSALIYGEAPGPNGADKSGIPFFGDRAGRPLYEALEDEERCRFTKPTRRRSLGRCRAARGRHPTDRRRTSRCRTRIRFAQPMTASTFVRRARRR